MAEILFRFRVFGECMALFTYVQVGRASRWEDEQSGWEGRVRQKVGRWEGGWAGHDALTKIESVGSPQELGLS